MKGLTSYHAGLAAEDIVARDYAARAHQVAARRWRGKAGEIDLILRDGDTLVFVEVKKSASFAQAALRLGRRQMDRLCASASEYLAGEPKGQLTDMRFDLALVDGRGGVSVIENAFMEA
ncbi:MULTISPECIES: YraN family protein [unclassified Yoonia]|uniref:YraN family protein n=1 Tax=unclassified Yoonia TaxID=2629118 RepID=UPI002AFFC2F2|nr:MULTISPECIES: YraN family protein [unclassified Yoonia]